MSTRRRRTRFKGPHDRLKMPLEQASQLRIFVQDLAVDLGLLTGKSLEEVLVGVFLTGMSCGVEASKEEGE